MYILPESMEPDGLVQLLSTDYKFAVSFSILIIVLLYRPSGIFKGKCCEKELKCNCSLQYYDGIDHSCWYISVLEYCLINI